MQQQSNSDEIIGAFTGFITWIFTHLFHFQFLQIPSNPIASELLIDSIRLVFTVLAAGIGYLVVHWIKKNITHEVKSKNK